MINLNQQFKTTVKDRLFYNRFEYSIGFHLDEISCLRDLDHDKIDRMIDRRITWREIAHQRVSGTIKSTLFGNSHTMLTRRHKEITKKTVSDLHDLAEILLTTTSDFKLVVSVNQGHVYTNDLELINQLSDLSSLTQKEYSQAIIDRPKNTIRLKNPKHQFRSYFKITKLTPEQKDHLTAFLLNQTTVRLSPALNEWIVGAFHRTQDYFFIDHDGMSWLTMLSLILPGIIRKTQQIIPAK